MRVLCIDNYDSFTYNVVQYLGELGADVRVFRNDELTLEQIETLAPEKITVGPPAHSPLVFWSSHTTKRSPSIWRNSVPRSCRPWPNFRPKSSWIE